ncbi:hypothetical protein N2152v2_001166 [Parachlorella kessleri]
MDATFSGALPKSEIKATKFLKDNPEYDGRGVIVAIFDTGVDPGAAGLQVTSDGKPKIVDVVDCTGSGDVDTSMVVRADGEGCIEGLTGRKLKLNPDWQNPSGDWRVGAKAAYELFPRPLKDRSKEERKKRWAEKQRGAVAEATAALAQFNQGHKGSLSEPDKKSREELETRVKLLTELDEKYEDLGPVLECVVWHDGSAWRAAIDTSDMYEPGSDQGLLADFTPLTNYQAERQYATFSSEDAFNFVCNIYEDGNVLSIVVDAGSHGTHVAGITAANYPEDPALNGVAPGAQIVSCKIGDSRLGSMETLVGLTRALIAVLDNGCHLINMSYGESTATPNMGRFIRLAEEVVHKHGVIFVSSAGNSGPALSTVGAPGGTDSAILGIGAYVTPALAAAGHSVRGELESGGQQYTWSSRGPTPDGDTGVNISAPGGAIAPVPQWTQAKRALMNGTSMASPNACGGLALVVSAMLAEGQAVTPARVRRAVENTALPVGAGDPAATLTYGRGLLQVDAAWDYLRRSVEVDVPATLRYEVGVKRSDGGAQQPQRGIYLREPADTLHPLTFQCEAKAVLKEGSDTKSEKLAVETKLVLRSTVPWVKAPKLLLMHHGARNLETEDVEESVQVDPTALPDGLHYGEVQGFDATAEWRGPLLRIPVTVIKPLRPFAALSPEHYTDGGSETMEGAGGADSVGGGGGASAGVRGALAAGAGQQGAAAEEEPGHSFRGDASVSLGSLQFEAGREVRRFIAVPEGATWAEMRIRAGQTDTPKLFLLRATQLLPHTRFSDSEHRSMVQLSAFGDHVSSFAVRAGGTLEVTLAQFWSSLGSATLDVDISFHGVEVQPAAGLSLDGAGGSLKVYARATLRREKIKPQVKLDTLRIPLRPTDAELAPLPFPRDTLPQGRVTHRLILTYKLSMAEAGKVTPTLPMLNGYVYDGELEAQMSMVFNTNKQKLAVSDIYPKEVQLKKGDYVIRLVLRHDDAQLLDKLKAMPLVAERKLDTAVTVPVYNTNSDSVTGSHAVSKERALCPGERCAYFLGPVPEDKLPKDATPGRLLVGSLTLGMLSHKGDASPAAAQVTYVVPPKKSNGDSGSSDSGAEGEEKPSPEEILNNAIRDAEVKVLKDMTADSDESKAAYEGLAQRLRRDYPGHLPVLTERVKRLAALPKEKRDVAALEGIIQAADDVIVAIDQVALAVYLAQKCPEEGPEAAKRKKEMDERKAALVDALAAKCRALLDAEHNAAADTAADGAAATEDTFEDTFRELRKWVDTSADAAHAVLHAQREARAGRLAGAVKALDKVSNPEDKPAAREVLELRRDLFSRLGWAHWERQEARKIADAFPPSYPLF